MIETGIGINCRVRKHCEKSTWYQSYFEGLVNHCASCMTQERVDSIGVEGIIAMPKFSVDL